MHRLYFGSWGSRVHGVKEVHEVQEVNGVHGVYGVKVIGSVCVCVLEARHPNNP